MRETSKMELKTNSYESFNNSRNLNNSNNNDEFKNIQERIHCIDSPVTLPLSILQIFSWYNDFKSLIFNPTTNYEIKHKFKTSWCDYLFSCLIPVKNKVINISFDNQRRYMKFKKSKLPFNEHLELDDVNNTNSYILLNPSEIKLLYGRLLTEDRRKTFISYILKFQNEIFINEIDKIGILNF